MATRYSSNRTINSNTSNSDSLREIIENRGRDSIEHYTTPKFTPLTVEQIQSLSFETYVWKSGDKFWKLSSNYYGNPKYWWVIAMYNNRPIEATVKVGELIQIPTPLSDFLSMVG